MKVRHLVVETAGFEGPLDMEGKEIECPECAAYHPASSWSAWDVNCESCGSHPILMCPNHHTFDPYNGQDEDLIVRDIDDTRPGS